MKEAHAQMLLQLSQGMTGGLRSDALRRRSQSQAAQLGRSREVTQPRHSDEDTELGDIHLRTSRSDAA